MREQIGENSEYWNVTDALQLHRLHFGTYKFYVPNFSGKSVQC